MPQEPLGLLAGSGKLPVRLVEHCRAIGRPIFVVAFVGQTDPALVEGVPHVWVRLGAVTELLAALRRAGIVDLVMAGRVRRPSFDELQPDWRATTFFARIGLKALGDDGLLRALRAELESEGFRLLAVNDLVEDLIAPPGLVGRHQPDGRAEADISHGFAVLAGLGALDIGQAVVVQQGLVLGVEAIEGTDRLIERCATLSRGGPAGVLVKARKPAQDGAFDLPTIGTETVERAAAAGLRGIAVEAGGTIILDRDEALAAADRLGLFLVARSPSAPAPLFYLIAGEPSGDVLGARLMQALRARTGGTARFAGIGGERMAEEGLSSLFPISGLAIIGILEVLPAARRILRWVRETVAEIERLRPVAVITIDSSGFCFRVAERLRRGRSKPPLIVHYVAPMVWAWRPYRAWHAKRAADHLLTLLPFEPPFFEKIGLPATFVGHPAIEAEPGSAERFRDRYRIAPDAVILAVLPGSRRAEVRHLLPIFEAAVALLAKEVPNLVVVLPTVSTVAAILSDRAPALPVHAIVVTERRDRQDAFAAARAAIAASGTVSLELAVADVPMVLTYKVSALTAWMLRRTVKLQFLTLVNILLERPLVPELMQEEVTAGNLVASLAPLLVDGPARQAQLDGFALLRRRLGEGGSPSGRAADKVLELVAARAA